MREAVKFHPLTLLPDGGDSYVQGLLTLREEIMPVVDLQKWLYANNPASFKVDEEYRQIPDEEKQIIVCEFNHVTRYQGPGDQRIRWADQQLHQK